MSESTLNSDQQACLNSLIDFVTSEHSEYVIEGYAGTGKTYTVGHFLEYLDAIKKLNGIVGGGANDLCFDGIVFTATTHKAVAALAENLPESIEVTTIFSLAKLTIFTDYKTGEQTIRKSKKWVPETARLLIFIDEASYLDAASQYYVGKTFPNAKIVYMGDPAQLVTVSDTPTDIFHNPKYPKSVLKKVVRNTGNIAAISAAFRDAVGTGVLPDVTQFVDNSTVFHMDGPDFQKAVHNTFGDAAYTPKDARIICWQNAYVQAYNNHIRQLRGISKIPQNGYRYVLNNRLIIDSETTIGQEKVLVVKNVAHYIQDPHIPEVVGCNFYFQDNLIFAPYDWHLVNQIKRRLKAQGNWYHYYRISEKWADLRLPFAGTTHKAQGSTFDKTFVDVGDICKVGSLETMYRLLYVACSRPRTKLYLYGELPPPSQGYPNEHIDFRSTAALR